MTSLPSVWALEEESAMTDKVIVGTGSYLPERVVTNDDIEAMALDFDRVRAGCALDEWCRKQMGAVQRRRVAPGEGTSDMGTRASLCALKDAGMSATDIDLIVLATITATTASRRPQPWCSAISGRPPGSSSSIRPALGSSMR